eukprot:3234875-Prorocentrum_lima.AAC.1
MTSSLVGSEMCIRDRIRQAPQLASGWSRTPRMCGSGGAGSREPIVCPVSYTHLTLPTICSV